MDSPLKHPEALHLRDVSIFLGESHPQPEPADQAISHPSLTLVMDSEPPEHAVTALPAWNQSRGSIFKTMATFFGFIVMGANDAVYGAIIPYLQTYYNVSYTVVSLVFLSPMCLYWLDLVMVFWMLHGMHGSATWANPNELLGFLHGFYGVGATIAPLVATAMITRAGLQWYSFYYIMIGGACIELKLATWAFWKETSDRFKASLSAEALKGATRAAVKTRVAWVSSIFLLLYVGIEVALGGWIVNFMIEVRRGGEFESGLVATGFWLGITVGRVVLGFLTPRLGRKIAICSYLILAVGLQLLFWLVPSFAVSSIAIALVGFMLGSLFPAVIVATTKLLPVRLHVATIGFAAAFGGSGACVFPFAIGAVAQKAGLMVLQPSHLGHAHLRGHLMVIWHAVYLQQGCHGCAKENRTCTIVRGKKAL